MEYGLIGGRLGHSYSKPIHEALAGYDYCLCPLPTPEEAHAFMRARDFKAINVTIPYKELVMPYCDVIDDAARAIGSVNAVKLTASSRIATASAWVSGAKLDRNVPGVAMSRSATES